MSNSGTIVHILPNKMPSKEELLAIQQVFPTVHGFCCQYEGRLEHEKHNKNIPIDELMKVLETIKSEYRYIWFGNLPSYEDLNDIQPYIIELNGVPVLAMMLQGKFDKWLDASDKHTAEYHNVVENLSLRIDKAIVECNGDADALITIFRSSEQFRKGFLNTFDGKGWFQFLPYKGQPFGYGNLTFTGFDWGTVSNVEGVTFPKKETAPPPAQRKSGGGLSFMAGGDPPPPPKQETTTTEVPIGFTMVSIPAILDESSRNRYIRLFYGANAIALTGEGTGDLPPNHKAMALQIPVANIILDYTKEKVTNGKEVKRLEDRLIGLALKRRQSGLTDPDKNLSSGTREPAANYRPAMNEKEITEQMGIWMTYLDNKSEKRPSPLEMQRMEANLPDYSTSVGIKFEHLVFAPNHTLNALFGVPGAAAFKEMRRKWIADSGVKLEDLVKTLDPELAKTQEKEETPQATTTQPTKSGGGLSFMKSA